MKKFTFLLLSCFLLHFSSVRANLIYTPNQVEEISEVTQEEFATVAPPQDKKSRLYQIGIQREKRHQQNLFKRARNGMLKKLFGRGWKRLSMNHI